MHKKSIEHFMTLESHSQIWLVYRKRLDKYIDGNLDMLYWLAINKPDVFLNVENLGNKRMKQLLLIIKALMKDNIDVELIKEVSKNDKTQNIQ
jgi:hypothetical protein